MNTPDRLNYSKNSKKIVEEIDKIGFLDLGNNESSRIELFTFAMALGCSCPLELESSEGFVLSHYIKPDNEALLNSISLSQCPDDSKISEYLERAKVYEYVQKCAEAGFVILGDWMENKSLEQVELELISKLDDLYDKILFD